MVNSLPLDLIDHFLTVYSEEQQPLEEFFKAKSIKFKNEMSEDVRVFPLLPFEFFITLQERNRTKLTKLALGSDRGSSKQQRRLQR